MEVHETGYAWRYIRTFDLTLSRSSVLSRPSGASMSLVGLVPPLSDNGRVLVDGGYGKCTLCLHSISSAHAFTVDNLPVSTMMRLGASTVFAVDVGSVSTNMMHTKQT